MSSDCSMSSESVAQRGSWLGRKRSGLRVFRAGLLACPAQDVAKRRETTHVHADGVAVKRLTLPRAPGPGVVALSDRELTAQTSRLGLPSPALDFHHPHGLRTDPGWHPHYQGVVTWPCVRCQPPVNSARFGLCSSFGDSVPLLSEGRGSALRASKGTADQDS